MNIVKRLFEAPYERIDGGGSSAFVQLFRRQYVGYIASVVGVFIVALCLWPFLPHVRSFTAANSLFVVVLLVALGWGISPALFASVLSALYLNYLFVRPAMHFKFSIRDTEDNVGLIAFVLTSVIVGHLSRRAQQRALKIEQLYNQLRVAFDRASQLEAIKKSEQLKSALLDTVTHDLRTPLTSIKAAATTLVRVRLNEASPSASSKALQDNLLTIIVKQSDRLNHFIDGMIELARIESGPEEDQTNAEATPMDEIIMTAIARAEDALRNHHVTMDCDENLKVKGNRRTVAQVLFSLLENAGKYAPAGTTIRVGARKDDRGNIRVTVEDEGPGIPRILRDKVFDKFFRGETADDAQTTGLGLGLAIARGIVGSHGGDIWVEDRDDGAIGARFVFTLPARFTAELDSARLSVLQ